MASPCRSVPGVLTACRTINAHGIAAIDLCHLYLSTRPGRNEPAAAVHQSVDWFTAFRTLDLSLDSVRDLKRLLTGPEPTAVSYFERRALLLSALEGVGRNDAMKQIKKTFARAGVEL